ncbi:MAG TPA: hypothetical protein DCY56_04875 [Candidatus Omnitrophica bacterium]|nr:hypothetical protein [Candidatus Omnitrophota bacterium]
MEYLKNKHIALFFSYKVSLNVWEDLGMITRESRIWGILWKNFNKVSFITYGNKNEEVFGKHFPSIKLLNNKWNLNPATYSIFLPFLYKKELMNIDLYKVNQVSGALPAIISKILYKKKLIIRCGFQLSLFLKKQKENIIKIFLALVLERISFYMADVIIVTSIKDREYIGAYHKVNFHKIKVISNGIDTELFNILEGIKKERGRILFVGRLIRQKNLFSLLEAVKGLKEIHLVIIGKGYLKEALAQKSKEYRVNVTFIERIKNEELPIEYNRSELFILPSLFEGNPKVLLEAMACGLPVICTDVDGMNTIVQHGVNGMLCQSHDESMKNSILELLNNEGLRKKLGQNARDTIVSKFSLDMVAEQEIFCYEHL